MRSDLTEREQTNVRTALLFLRTRCGGWEALAKVLSRERTQLRHVAHGRTVSASLAVRIARLARVGVDDVLTGKYPSPTACPHCGYVPDGEEPRADQ